MKFECEHCQRLHDSDPDYYTVDEVENEYMHCEKYWTHCYNYDPSCCGPCTHCGG